MEETWVKAYETELDRAKRAEILETAIAEEGLSPSNELRKKLLETRYGKKQSTDVDYFIRGWMRLIFLQSVVKRFFAKRQVAREVEGIRSDFQLELAKSYGEAGEQVLYEEFCNTARLYLNLCAEDKNYNSILFGLGRMKKESLVNKIARDFYNAAYAMPEQVGLTEDLAPFRRALVDVFSETYPESASLLTDRIPA